MVLLILALITSADSIAVEEDQSLFSLKPYVMVDFGFNIMKTSLNQRSVDYFDSEILQGQGSGGVIGARAGLRFLGGLGFYGEARSWILGVSLFGEGGAGGDQWLNVSNRMYGGGLSYVHDFSDGKIAGINAGLGSYGGSVKLRERGTMGNVWEGDLRNSQGVNIGILYGGPIRSEIVDAFWALEFAYHRANQDLETTYTGVEPQTEDLHLFDLKFCLRYSL